MLLFSCMRVWERECTGESHPRPTKSRLLSGPTFQIRARMFPLARLPFRWATKEEVRFFLYVPLLLSTRIASHWFRFCGVWSMFRIFIWDGRVCNNLLERRQRFLVFGNFWRPTVVASMTIQGPLFHRGSIHWECGPWMVDAKCGLPTTSLPSDCFESRHSSFLSALGGAVCSFFCFLVSLFVVSDTFRDLF